MSQTVLWGALIEQFLLWLMAFLFLLPLIRKPHWVLRSTVCICLSAALRLLTGIWLPAALSGAFSGIFVAVFFWQCADIGRRAVIFCSIWVISLCQFWRQVSGAVYRVLNQTVDGSFDGAALTMSLLLLGLAYLIVGTTIARCMPDKGRYQIGPRQITASVLSFIVFELLSVASFHRWQAEEDWKTWAMIMLLEMYSLTLLYLQHEMFKKSALRQEIALFNQLHAQQKAQYTLAKENIELINRKCHDLKHQMKAIRMMSGNEAQEKYLKEVEGAIRIYGSIVTTGNEVLDTVLTEKSLYCEAHSIQAHCVADGHLLDFMDPVDLYTIFGNVMDNAIEGVKDLKQKEKRFIDVLVYRENQLLAIQVTNPIEKNLDFDEEGLPRTTKEQNGYHGFGLRSIRHTVSKYGGFLSVSVENDCFCLRILLPMEQEGTTEAE